MAEVTSYDRDVYEQLAAVEEGSFWFRSRNALIVWAIRQYAPQGWAQLLEVGCGTGYVLSEIRKAFPDAELSGSDFFAEGLAFASARVPDAHLEQLDVLDMPHREAFDIVGAFDVIEHIGDDRGALRGIRQAVRPGGLVILTVPQHPALWSPQDVAAHHVRRYVSSGLHAKVKEAGFDVVRSTSFVSLLLPAMLATRRMPERTTVGDLRRPRLIDAGLSAIMVLERATIRAGVSWPAGGSRLVVARRPG
jgi:SAM-dependent methyltransferase